VSRDARCQIGTAGAIQLGVPQPRPWPYREQWIPVYQVHRSVRCYLCRAPISRALGIQKAGGRARAFLEKLLDLWRCVDCQAEASRAEGARLERGA
jgi:hypothetical protein